MKGKRSAPGSRRHASARPRGKGRGDDGVVRIYGRHAVQAALANPDRKIRRVCATLNAAQRLMPVNRTGLPELESLAPGDLDHMLGADAVHQGILIEAEALPELSLADLPDARLILFLDQVTDPHNVGAILRSAAAFAVDAIVVTARHSPPLEGALAKAASGALEYVPVIQVVNLARALAEAGDEGFVRLGLDSDGEVALEDFAPPGPRLALVLGAEDRGLRRLTREHCDAICALTAFGPIASLNVSNAAAIALHMMAHKMRNRPAV
jgi:23S rRNA (guanosine2251-2'-O)-methyltransferase